MKEIPSLGFELNKKYRHAIECGYFDTWEQDPRQWKHTFAGAFVWKYPDRCITLKTFQSMLGRLPTWEDITDDNLRDLVEELLSGDRTESSVRTMCAELKSLLRENRRKIFSEEHDRILSIKPTATRHVYITEEEMERIIEYTPKTHAEEFVRRNFLVSMMTGARLSDAQRLTIDNCNSETGILSYIPIKTKGIVVNVPVNERYGLRNLLAITELTPCDLSTYNDLIRAICQRLCIDAPSQASRHGKEVTAPKYELVSSHTARRSFATNLYLAYVHIEDIALMMGHGKNTETTKRYICAERPVSPNVMSYFQAQPQSQFYPAP